MKHTPNFTRAVACLLALLMLTGLLAGCNSEKSKPVAATVAQMNDAGYTIGLPSGAAAVNAVLNTLPKAKVQYYNSLSDGYLAVQQGKVDAFAFDRNLLGFAIVNGLTGVKILSDDVGAAEDVAVGLSERSAIPDLEQRVNDALAALQADGTLDEMFKRWVLKADDTMPDIPKAENPTETLKVGTSGLVQPFSYYKGNELTGYDLELAARLAYSLNAKLEIKTYDYDGFPPALESGAIDCVLANLNATPERRETMGFSNPLYKTRTALLVRDDGAKATADRRPLETATYGVMTGSTAETYLAKTYPNAKIATYSNIPDAIIALASGKVDYVMTSRTTSLTAVRNNAALTISHDNVDESPVACAVSKDNPALLKKIDDVLTKFKADGTLDRVTANWTTLGQDYIVEEVPVSNGENGTLRVAISADREPMCFVMDNVYRGVDCELVERIAYELGMKVEYQNMSFSGLISALKSGKADIALSNLTPTPERAESVDFTQIYFDNPQVLLARKPTVIDASAPQYTNLSQLSGKLIAAKTGTTLDLIFNKVMPNITYNYYNNQTDQVLAVANGKAEAMLSDEPPAQLIVAQNPDLAILPERIAEDQYGIALQKDSPLTAEVNAAIAQLKADGTLDEMKKKWMGADDSVKTLPQLDYPGAKGTLRAAHEIAVEPMGYVGANGVLLGYDLEMILRIGEIMDRKVEFTGMEFAGLLSSLQSGKADVAVGCISITDERKKMIDMSDPYYEGGVYCVVRKAADPAAVKKQEGFWEGLKASFVRTFVTENRWKLVVDGLWVTILISVCSGAFGSLTGFGICMLRRSKLRAVSVPTAAFIRLIQGTPIVVLLMILYYILFGGVDISAILVAVFGFSVNFGVYVSEIMRTGIDAVDHGQIEAAYALGYTRIKTFWKITFPQAARHFLPVFKGEFISMVKMTSVVGYIAIQDLTKVSDIIRSRTMEAFFPLIATAVLYFLVANLLTMLLSRLEIRLDPKRRKQALKGVVMK